MTIAEEVSLRELGQAWSDMDEARTAITNDQERVASSICAAAHELLKNTLVPYPVTHYQRSGQYPTLTAVTEEWCEFLVTNGFDETDDFSVRYHWRDLLDPEGYEARWRLGGGDSTLL